MQMSGCFAAGTEGSRRGCLRPPPSAGGPARRFDLTAALSHPREKALAPSQAPCPPLRSPDFPLCPPRLVCMIPGSAKLRSHLIIHPPNCVVYGTSSAP